MSRLLIFGLIFCGGCSLFQTRQILTTNHRYNQEYLQLCLETCEEGIKDFIVDGNNAYGRKYYSCQCKDRAGWNIEE